MSWHLSVHSEILLVLSIGKCTWFSPLGHCWLWTEKPKVAVLFLLAGMRLGLSYEMWAPARWNVAVLLTPMSYLLGWIHFGIQGWSSEYFGPGTGIASGNPKTASRTPKLYGLNRTTPPGWQCALPRPSHWRRVWMAPDTLCLGCMGSRPISWHSSLVGKF